MVYRKFLKRVLDFVLAGFFLLLLSPLFIIIMVLVRLESAGPVFFKQKRLGKSGRVFKIWKFRTMQQFHRLSDHQVFHDHPEITRVGRFLRRYKLDELPQLFNILKGDMAVIGPRPCLPELKNEFDENGHARLLVKPGLAGLADINGGYFLPWPKRWVHDKRYVENISFWLDLKILVRIPFLILFDEDYFLRRNTGL